MTTATMERPITTKTEQPTKEAETTLETRHKPTYTLAPDELDVRIRKAAARYLEIKGLDILDQEWLCDSGQIDIICWDGKTLVFVDVQTGFKEFSNQNEITAKRSLMEAIAIAYLSENEYIDIPVRFDVLCVAPIDANRAFLRHQVNALGTV